MFVRGRQGVPLASPPDGWVLVSEWGFPALWKRAECLLQVLLDRRIPVDRILTGCYNKFRCLFGQQKFAGVAEWQTRWS